MGGDTIDSEIILNGKKIILHSVTKHSWHEYYRNYIPDQMMDTTPYTYNYEQAEALYVLKTNDETRFYFSIIADKKVIGQIYLKHIDKQNRRTEFGIALINDTVKCKGYGTEAISLIIGFAFKNLKLKTILADSVLRNTRSQYVLQKLGFKYTHEDLIFKYYRLDLH